MTGQDIELEIHLFDTRTRFSIHLIMKLLNNDLGLFGFGDLRIGSGFACHLQHCPISRPVLNNLNVKWPPRRYDYSAK